MANQITVDIVADTRSLVAGVKTTNNQLSSLNQSIGKVKTAFGGLAAAFGFQVGISFLKDALKGAAEDEAAFARLGDLFGKDIEAITTKVNELSSTFKVDDGAIAQYFVELKSAFSSNFDSFVPDVVEASATLALLTGKPLDTVIAQWGKTLKDGKITAQEVQKLGIDLTKEQEQQFNKLTTTAQKLQFLLDIINSPENQKKALDNLTPYQKFNYYMEKLKDTIGAALLPVLEKLFNWYDKLSPGQKKIVDGIIAFTVGIAALAAALAPLVFVVEAFIGLFTAWGVGTTLASVGTRLLSGAMMMLPFAPLIVAIGLVIAGIVLLVKNWDTVKAAFQKGVEAIKNAFNSVKEWFSGLGDKIRSAVGNLLEVGKKFGSDIINGLVQGIKNMAMAPINAIKGVVSGVTGAIKSFLKIGSPSKVFAGFGKNIVEGLSIGIDGAQKLAVGSMADLSTGLSLTPNFGTSRGGVNVTINAGLGTDPYELGRAVRAALNKYDGVNGR